MTDAGLSVRKLVGGEPVIVGGDLASAEGAMLLGGSGGMLPREKKFKFHAQIEHSEGFFFLTVTSPIHAWNFPVLVLLFRRFC